MKILLVNKYLYRKGGAETYFIKLGEYLKSLGNEVEYFGMADERNCVRNRVEAYTENIDFHKKSLKHITYPFKIIYSVNARKQIRKVLSDFKPDVVHLNNFNYQLTPSIIYEIKKRNIPIVYTAHDVQKLSNIPFVFAGKGELENEVNSADNIKNVGFKTGDELRNIIEKALFTVLPAEWSENCPFSVMESQSLMTPVLGAKIGGIPELIDDGKTGILFESGNLKELTEKIEYLYNNKGLCRQMSENCRDIKYDTIKEYSEKLIKLYKEVIK